MHTMNGRLAVDYLCKSPMQCSFVLLDIVMPVMDGVETLRAIKVREIGVLYVVSHI